MSTNTPGSNSVAYLPTSRDFPEDPRQLSGVTSKAYFEIAQAVNRRTIGIFNTFQIVTGDQYYSNANNNNANPIQFRQAYRQLYVFGAINAGSSLTIAHGITGITEIVHLYGNCITDGSNIATAIYEPIPFVSTSNINQQISLWMNGTDIIITNGAGNNNILSGTIIVEYLLN